MVAKFWYYVHDAARKADIFLFILFQTVTIYPFFFLLFSFFSGFFCVVIFIHAYSDPTSPVVGDLNECPSLCKLVVRRASTTRLAIFSFVLVLACSHNWRERTCVCVCAFVCVSVCVC